MLGHTGAELRSRRSYAFLIERLLRPERLRETRLASLQAALRQGDADRLHQEAVAALLDLEADGWCEELPSQEPRVRCFRQRDSADVFRLVPPRARLQASRPNSVAKTNLADLDAPPQARPATWPAPEGAAPPAGAAAATGAGTQAPRAGAEPQAAAAALDVEPAAAGAAGTDLDALVHLASVEAPLEPFGDRLRRLLVQVEAALPATRAELVRLEGEGADALGDGPIQVLERAAVDRMPHAREALRRGTIQFATTAPEGADPGQGRIAAAAPVFVGGEAWGLLQILWPPGTQADIGTLGRLLAPVARLVTIAIQNQATLEKLVFVDPLTGVYNRAFYERQVALEIERANRTSLKLALLVMDVDDFKQINDRFGHRAGDQVLAQLAREVRARMRRIDLMFRYGGEEFVILLPGADLEEAQRTAERLRLVVGEQRFHPEGAPEPLRVTVSLGGAVYPDQSRTKTGLFNAADAALYRAKNAGKNRVAF